MGPVRKTPARWVNHSSTIKGEEMAAARMGSANLEPHDPEERRRQGNSHLNQQRERE
jgi:hypothetical protein